MTHYHCIIVVYHEGYSYVTKLSKNDLTHQNSREPAETENNQIKATLWHRVCQGALSTGQVASEIKMFILIAELELD